VLNGLPAWILIILGIGVVLISLLPHKLGLGGYPNVFGWKQLMGVVLGGVLMGAGLMTAIKLRPQFHQIEAQPGEADLKRARVPDSKPIYDSAAVRVPFIHELTELYRYRYLLLNLISRDLKVRYKRSVLGFFWAMVNPLLTMAVMVVVFTSIFNRSVEHYPIYLLSGILLWRFFASGTSLAMRSVLSNSSLSKKIYVPASIFVASSIGSALVNLLFSLLPLLLIALLTGIRPDLAWLFLATPILLIGLLAFGIGCIVAALAVFFADMLDIYEVLLNAFFYFTPIIYPAAMLPEILQRLQQYNLMHLLIDSFRMALIEGQLPAPGNMLLAVSGVALFLVAGWSFFTRLADQFPYHA